ncbi:HAD hydrolase-like protein, partial [Rhodococcus sp. UFZ-B548]|uniref:HAD hydrolase-like protein n=1 Tax=Rhodococcus sp. UFZ-B548 TaxID=2742212 RepID=UPI0015F46C11
RGHEPHQLPGTPLKREEPGKPSLTGFLTATELMHVEPEATVMVGDDLIGDVLSSQRVGLTGVLVRTGKFRQTVLDLSVQKPDHVIDSVADLPALLGVVLEA